MTWSKLNQVPGANIAKINGIVIDADDAAAAGEIKKMNSVTSYTPPIPDNLIIPYTAGAGGAPAGWELYAAADGNTIFGAGNTWAVDASGASAGNITASTNTTGAHTGVTPMETNLNNSGGKYRNSSSTGDHTHDFTLAYDPPYQECYLIRTTSGNETEFPAGSVLFTDSEDKSGVATNVWTDGYMFKANNSVGTGGSNTLTDQVSDSAGGHAHGILDCGNSSGLTTSRVRGAHTHTETFTMSNMWWARLMAAWSDAVGAVSLEDYGSNIIAMYENTTPPSGWYLCDGNNGTPNLLDRMIIPVAQASAGSNQGDGKAYYETAGTLTHANHTHEDGNNESGGGNNNNSYHAENVAMTAHTQIDTSVSWWPAYYCLAFIMYGG